MIFDIVEELNMQNGSNYKMDVLRKHKDNKLLQRVLKMTYDKVTYTYGVTLKNVDHPGFDRKSDYKRSLSDALDYLENNLATRKVTGNAALDGVADLLFCLEIDDRRILHGVINRDLRINMGRSNINKVFKNLIVKPVYMRCGLYNKKTREKINPVGAYTQLKADGTYREFTVEDGDVICNSRSGETYEYPVLNSKLSTYPDGHYIGELTVMEGGVILDRATGNGLINSDEPPHENIMLDLWDYITLEEYSDVANKIKGKTPYHVRFEKLLSIIGDELSPTLVNIRVIETEIVNNFSEALQICSKWMNDGKEGAILKDKDAIFRDGTSPQQLKLKLEIDVDARITGFTEGRVGTVREATFGAITFETDDGHIKGQTSGFTEAQLVDFNNRRAELIGQIMTVTCNDITKGRGNDYYALSHPRFTELRNDKTETDTLDRAMKAKEMAMEIGNEST